MTEISVGNVELEVTIGMFGGSCITRVVVSNPNFDSYLNEMGGSVEDLVDSSLPQAPGVYVFSGETFFIDSIDDPEDYTEWQEPRIKA